MTDDLDPLSEAVRGHDDPYHDTDLMQFGKYKNVMLQDVPASYLHWLWTQRPISDSRLEAYIKHNLSALKEEFPDGIWT